MRKITQMSYQPDRRGMAVEMMTFDRLRAMNRGGTQRADFHILGLVDSGQGSVTIDFLHHRLVPRSAVWITPGAVHRWDDIGQLSGHLTLFVPTAPVTRATRELVTSGPDSSWRVPDEEWPLVDAARAHLLLEAASATGVEFAELPTILLSALLTRLRPPHKPASTVHPEFRKFHASVETHFREHHDTAYYANALGYSSRTLSRMAQRATGRTAKAYIVDRIVLEAKRLLSHDRLTAATCATALGFPDASSFSVFFRNATGIPPGVWRTDHDGARAGRVASSSAQ